jgi:hypothetical protein
VEPRPSLFGMWHKKALMDFKLCLCSAQILIFLNLQWPFDIDTNASDYVIGTVVTQHGHSVAYPMKHYMMLFTDTPPTTNICTPLCKHVDSGIITFSERKQSSTLIIGLYHSCRHKESYKMTTIISGPCTYNNST